MQANKSGGDSTLYWFDLNGETVILLVYVDDILVASQLMEALIKLKSKLMKKYVMSDMGPVSLMLGIEIQKENSGVKLHQSEFIQEIPTETEMTKCNPTTSPMEQSLQLRKVKEASAPVSQEDYRRVVGQLQYLVYGTRPEFSFCVGYMSRFCHRPSEQHWAVVKRVLRYLSGTSHMGIAYSYEDKEFHLTGY